MAKGEEGKATVEREFPIFDREGVEYRCQNCDFLTFKAREAYGHAVENNHRLTQRIEVEDGSHL